MQAHRTLVFMAGLLLSITSPLALSQQAKVTTSSDAEMTASTRPAVEAFERVLGAQNRVNRYFHSDVVPKLTGCWSTLKSRGGVTVHVTYRREANRWQAPNARAIRSTLAKGEDAVALNCLQSALRGTSFPTKDTDAEATQFQITWGLPVPWPKDAADVIARISTGGGGGKDCGGPEGPAPACWDCAYIPFIGVSYCARSCAGYTNCAPTAQGCNVGPINPRCVTSSPFGNVGGVVMY